MPDDSVTYHIVLLPSDGYWAWVQAIRDFAVAFHVHATPTPETAVDFHRPDQVITVVNTPGGYPAYGSVVDWLAGQAPEVKLDVISVGTAAQLHQLLAERVVEGQRLGTQFGADGHDDLPIRLRWPTDYPATLQNFDDNAELYRHWGLPGHDGVDIRAPHNARIYACADGVVYRVHDGTGGHPYGIHVRIRHDGGYKTVYAHLNQALVHSGQAVSASDVIGLADATGNSAGSKLHLTLKKEGATAAGETPYPADIIDPTPYLIMPVSSSLQHAGAEEWPYDTCLVGVHARVGAPMGDADWNVLRTARVGALLFGPGSDSLDVDHARAVDPHMFLMARLTVDFRGRTVRAPQFVDWVRDDLRRFYDRGIRYFELHSEPNLTTQGFGSSWFDGYDFGKWFLEVVGLLRPTFPEARFGWPGLSPGPSTSGVRFDHVAFLEGASSAMQHADWLGCHCFWENDAEMFSEDAGLAYKYYVNHWPDKLLLITEFSNPSPRTNAQIKGSQYLQYFNLLQREPGVGAAFAFAVSAPAHYDTEVWRDESGRVTPIVAAVSSRSY